MGLLATLRERFRPRNALDTSGLTPQQFADMLDSYGLLMSSAGVSVTPETAAKAIPVQACCCLIAGGIVSMPLQIVKRTISAGRWVQEPTDDHDYWWLLNESPNGDYAAAALWQKVVWDLKLRGESFVRIVRANGGRSIRPKALIHERDVIVDRQWDAGDRIWYTARYLVTTAGRTFGVLPEDMLHFRGNLAQSGAARSAELEAAREAIGLTLAIEQYCGRFFTNGGTPRTVIAYPPGTTLTDQQISQLRESWVRRYGGVENTHLPLVLSNGGKVERVSATAAEAQMLEQRKFQVIEIARAMQVPPFMVGETEKTSAWGTGIEQMSQGFIRYTLNPLMESMQQEMTRKLFGTARYFVDFDESALDKGDMKSLGDWFRQAVGGSQGPGFMTVNEVRRRLNMPPIDGGDETYDLKAGATADAESTVDGTPANPAGPQPDDAAAA